MTVEPFAPQGAVPAINIPNSQDYPRLVFTSPYFETVALAELIAPAVTEAVEAQLPSLVPPFVDQAAQDAVNQLAVLLAGSTMQGPLYLNPVMPTQPSQAASMAYVDSMIATAGIPEVPPTPIGQVWARETGQWVPISQSGGTYLPLGGGTMQGQINMSGNAITNLPALPVMPNGAAPAQWVLQQISAVSLYQGTWNMDTYTPDLTQLSTHVNGWTWIAITTSASGVVIGPPIPGLQGQTVFNGDTVIYSATAGAFQSIHSGGLTLAEANALYLSLNGGQLSGPLLLNANATQPTQAVTLQQLQTLVAGYVAPDAPTDGQGYLRVGATHGWTPGLPLTGGVTTGPILLSGNATNALAAVPYQQLVSYTAGLYLPTAGGTMVGPLVLAGNATAPLNPVTLTQLTSILGSYVPLQGGGAITGNVSVLPPSSPVSLPPGATPGSLLGSTVSAVGNYAVACYYDGTNWRQLPGTGISGAHQSPAIFSSAGSGINGIWLYSSPTAADNAVLSPQPQAVATFTATQATMVGPVLAPQFQVPAANYGDGQAFIASAANNTSDVVIGLTVPNIETWIHGVSALDGAYYFSSSAGGPSTVVSKLSPAGLLTLGQGNVCRSGSSGSYQGNVFNFSWTSSVVGVWIDTVFMGDIAYTSDYRIKKDVTELPSMWETVKALHPIKYTQAEYTPPVVLERKREMEAKGQEEGGPSIPMFPADDIERWGFVAHELQEILTQSASSGTKDQPDAVQSPNPFTLLACLCKALQEAMTRIEALEAKAAA